jgi:hypothetical protein
VATARARSTPLYERRPTMAKVKIHLSDGKTVETTATTEDDEQFYDDLPYTSQDVLYTQVSD